MNITKKVISIFLTVCLLVSVAIVGVVPVSAESNESPYTQDTVQGSAILHCFCWSYDTIRQNLPQIKAAGYSAIQTSPVQPPKDYDSSWTDTSGQWWKLYQPLDLAVTDGNYGSWLGTKAQFTQMCSEAENYGIKVIVDIVANHLANNGSVGNGAFINYLNSGVNNDLKNSDYFFDNVGGVSSDSRYKMTHGHLGMPELNTANSVIQNKVLNLMKECVDCGADGFRFDTAKHIELPTDDDYTKSDFWPTVINGINNYKSGLYIYGEILGDAYSKDINRAYTQYMDLTEDYTCYRAREAVKNQNGNQLHESYYQKGISADQAVMWAESHDTYMNNDGDSKYDTNDTIVKTWAMINSRAETTSLYFVRPGSMGTAGSDTTWKSTPVVESNKFKNIFEGQSEYLSYSGKVAYNERGNKGMVIVNTDTNNSSVSLPVHKLADGTYLDHVTNTNFTVSGGVISGTVDSSGVAVIYNEGDTAEPHIEADTLYMKPERSSWTRGNERYAMYVFNNSTNAWVSMTDTDNDGIYEADVPEGTWTGVIFCRMNGSTTDNNWDNKWNQTVDLLPTGDNNLFTVTDKDSNDNTKYTGTWSVHSTAQSTTAEPTTVVPTPTTAEPTTPSSDTYTIYAINKANWSKVSVHYWGDGETEWPGADMTSISGTKVYSFEVPKNVSGIVFTNGASSSTKQTGNITSGITDGATWIIGSASSNNYPVSVAPDYYLVGTMNSWSNKDNYKFSISATDSGKLEYKLSGVQLAANAEFKVHSSSDTWYPGGSDNNYTVSADGTYDIYFRPNGDGNEDWHENYFYAVNVTPYTVTWVDGDGNTLKTDTVIHGDTPEYSGETPLKTATAQYTYAFNNTWSPAITPATGNVTYEAQFDANINTYTVTWVNYDDSVLETDSAVEFGTMPEYNGQTPIKEGDAQYSYTFAGWFPIVSEVTSAITYKAVYDRTVNKYTVTFQNYDGTELSSEEYEYGSTPLYIGIPVKSPDASYHYSFSGWDNSIQPVSGTAVYTAQYNQTAHNWDDEDYEDSWDPEKGSDINDPNSFTPSCDLSVVCEDCGYEATLDADVTLSFYTPASCSEKGTAVYTATAGNISTTGTYDTPMIGHTYGAPVWSWSSDYTTATATFTCTECRHQEVQYPPTEVSATQMSTCTQAGYITHTAVANSGGQNYTDSVNEVLPAQGHHMTEHPAHAATCSAAGNTAYYSCDRCNKYFSDEDGNNEIEEDSWITHDGDHDWDFENGEWYWDFDGLDTNDPENTYNQIQCVLEVYCNECGTKTQLDTTISFDSSTPSTCYVNGEQVFTATLTDYPQVSNTQSVELPITHELAHVNATQETCTEPGNTEYWYCTICGKHFSDANGENELENDSWVIPATGHRYVSHSACAPTYVDGTYKNGTDRTYYTCEVCGEEGGYFVFDDTLDEYVQIAENDLFNIPYFEYEYLSDINTIRLIKCNSDDTDITLPDVIPSQFYPSDAPEGRICSVIKEEAFANLTNLENVIIGDNVNHIAGRTNSGNGAFYGCTSLETVSVGNRLDHVGTDCFNGCSSLTDLTTTSTNGETLNGVDDIAYENEALTLHCYHDSEIARYIYNNNYITFDYLDTDPVEHTYRVYSWDWSDFNAEHNVVAKVDCSVCWREFATLDANIVEVTDTPATCTTEGSGHYKATVTYEGQNYEDDDEGRHTFTIPVDSGAHTMTHHPYTAPTLTTDGNTEYWECTTCHKYFSDAEGENEIEEGSWVLEKTAVAKYGPESSPVYVSSFRSAVVNTNRQYSGYDIIQLKDVDFEWDMGLINASPEITSFSVKKNGHTLNVTAPEGYKLVEETEGDVTTYTVIELPSIPYLDENGETQYAYAIPITANTTTVTDGWYYVYGNVTLDRDITITGDVKVILTNSNTLSLENNKFGINEDNGSSLTFYEQSNDSSRGELSAKDIYIGSLTIVGGKLTVSERISTGGNFVMSGGVLNADRIISEGDVTFSGGDAKVDARNGAQVSYASDNAITCYGNAYITGGSLWAYGHSALIAISGTDSTITITGGDTVLQGFGAGMLARHVKVLGGKLHATAADTDNGGAGIKSYNEIELSWTDVDNDYVYANKYYTYSGTTDILKPFYDQNNAIYAEGATDNTTLECKGLNPYNDIGIHLVGHSISLDGSIGVNFYMELSDDVIANANTAYMHFTIPKNGTPGTQDVYVRDAEIKRVGGKDYYCFTCNVAAKEIESNITAQLINGDESSLLYTYSVKQYADYLIAHQDDSPTFKKAVPLVQAMLTYGENAMYYFDKTGDRPNDIEVEIPEYGRNIYDLPEGVTFAGATLSLKSETTLSLYFNSATEPTLTCENEGYTCETKQTGANEYVIRIRGIAAYDLDKVFTVDVNGHPAVDYSPMTYCYKSQNSNDVKLANTVKALYKYMLAAKEYFDEPENGGGN